METASSTARSAAVVRSPGCEDHAVELTLDVSGQVGLGEDRLFVSPRGEGGAGLRRTASDR